MFLTKKFIALVIAVFAALIAYYLDLRRDREVIINVNIKEKEKYLSDNARQWLRKGNFFSYNNKYKIFYVLEKINGAKLNSFEEKSPITIQSDDIVNVFLHGFPTSSYDFKKIWDKFLASNDAELSNQYLFAFDYLGYGFSDKPLDYSYSIFDTVDMIERLLLHLNINNFNLIAHDVGDSVAQELLRRFNIKNTIQPDLKIKSCILMNGGIVISVYKPRLGQILLRNKYLANIWVKYFFNYYLFKQSFLEIFGTRPSDEDLNDFYEIITYNNGHLALPLTIGYIDNRIEYGEVWYNALNETMIPLSLIYGPADPINPADTYPNRIKEDLPSLKFIKLADSVGHYPQWEDPVNVYKMIIKHLKK